MQDCTEINFHIDSAVITWIRQNLRGMAQQWRPLHQNPFQVKNESRTSHLEKTQQGIQDYQDSFTQARLIKLPLQAFPILQASSG